MELPFRFFVLVVVSVSADGNSEVQWGLKSKDYEQQQRRSSPSPKFSSSKDEENLAFNSKRGDVDIGNYIKHLVSDNGKMASLVEFLLGQSSDNQLIFTYDDSIPGVGELVRRIQENTTDMVIMKYEPNLISFRDALRTNFTKKIGSILLLCSAVNIINTFEMIKTRSLESPTIQWMVVVEDGEYMLRNLQKTLREGTQVVVAVKTDKGGNEYQLQSSYVDKENQYRFDYAGTWNLLKNDMDSYMKNRDHTLKTSYYLRRPLFLPLEEVYQDFYGRRLVVSVVDNFPYFKLRYLENGTALPDAGVDYQVMKTISDQLNFTFEIQEPADGRYGTVLPNGSITGIVGMVAFHKAHFGIDEITITEMRETVVDFSYPYILEGTTFVSRAPTKMDPTYAIFKPFKHVIWFLLGTMVIFAGFIGYVITRFQEVFQRRYCYPSRGINLNTVIKRVPRTISDGNAGELQLLQVDQHNNSATANKELPINPETFPNNSAVRQLLSYCFSMFRSLVLQGTLHLEGNISIRILFAFWYIFSLIMYALYAGTLTSFMTVPAFEKPIDSPEDLLEAYDDGFIPAVEPSTSNEYFFKSADSGVFKELWRLTDPSRSFPNNGHEAMEKVLSDNIVYMSGNLNTEIRSRQKGRHLFHLSREKFLVQGFGIVCRPGAPYIQNINRILQHINEGGLLLKWVENEVQKLPPKRISLDSRGPLALTLRHLQAGFFLFLSGTLVSFAIFMGEILQFRYHFRKQADD